MLAQDKTAFIEHIEVTPGEKRADKRRRRIVAARLQAAQLSYEVRLSEDALAGMQRAFLRGEGPRSVRLGRGFLRRRHVAITERDVETARARLTRRRAELAAKQARLSRLEQEAAETHPRARTVWMYRLHSSSHHIECSERRFAQWSAAQRVVPVWVTTKSGRRWWWYGDRFWWDDEGLKADDVKLLVVESDRAAQHQREAVDQLREDVFRVNADRRDRSDSEL